MRPPQAWRRMIKKCRKHETYKESSWNPGAQKCGIGNSIEVFSSRKPETWRFSERLQDAWVPGPQMGATQQKKKKKKGTQLLCPCIPIDL